MSKWHEDTTYRFVEEYGRLTCLWQSKSPEYRNKKLRYNAYYQLAKAMNIKDFGVSDVKLKIKSLRTTFFQEFKKIEESRKSGVSEELVYVPQLKWFQLMHSYLCGPDFCKRKQKSVKKEMVTCDNIDADDMQADGMNTDDEIPIDPIKDDDGMEFVIEERLNNLSPIPSPPGASRLRKHRKMSRKLEDYRAFGEHVAAEMARLSPINAMIAQEEIQSILTRLRIGELKTDDRYLSTNFVLKPSRTYEYVSENIDENSAEHQF